MTTLEQTEQRIERQELYEQLEEEANKMFKLFVKAVKAYLSKVSSKDDALAAEAEFVKAKCRSITAGVAAGVEFKKILDSTAQDGEVNIGGYWFDATPFYEAVQEQQ